MVKKPLAKLRALRALAEGTYPSLELLAEASSRSLKGLRQLAVREQWKLHDAGDDDIHSRIKPIIAKLLDKIEAVNQRAAQEEGRIERAEIDMVLTMLRAIDKIAELQRPEEAAAKKQKQDDETLAAVLERINSRIIYLARALAAQMVAQERHTASDDAAGEHVDQECTPLAVSAAAHL